MILETRMIVAAGVMHRSAKRTDVKSSMAARNQTMRIRRIMQSVRSTVRQLPMKYSRTCAVTLVCFMCACVSVYVM